MPSNVTSQLGVHQAHGSRLLRWAAAAAGRCRAAGLTRLGSKINVTGDDIGVELRRADGGVIAVAVVGEPDTTPVLFCHGLADSRLSAYNLAVRPAICDCV